MKKLKYVTIFLLPATVAISFLTDGMLTFLPLFVFFVGIPILELVFPVDARNLEQNERALAEKDGFYDFLLFIQVPIQIGFLFWYLSVIPNVESTSSIVGKTLAMGIMSGIIGINLGHELGHRNERFPHLMGEILLLTSLENHFIPYHNRGHHNDVATPKDPATARLNEPLYLFWFRSHFGSYFAAWRNEFQRMQIIKKPKFSIQNKMVVYTLASLILCGSIYWFFGLVSLLYFLITATIGILLLETVNYIEHYGLLRKQREDGTYERVRRTHSWNSDHIIGRVVLFELSRHSDHHYKPDKHYQLLDSHEESPQMPTGYPGMMLLALIPPLFFNVMKPHVSRVREL